MEPDSTNFLKIATIDIFALFPAHRISHTWPILRYAPCHYIPYITERHGVLLNTHNGLIKVLYKHPNRNHRNSSIPLLPLHTGFHAQYAPTTNIIYSSYTFIRFWTHALHTRTLPVKARHQQEPVSFQLALLILICAVWKPSTTTYIITVPIVYHAIKLTFRITAQPAKPASLYQRSSLRSVPIVSHTITLISRIQTQPVTTTKQYQ